LLKTQKEITLQKEAKFELFPELNVKLSSDTMETMTIVGATTPCLVTNNKLVARHVTRKLALSERGYKLLRF
jgi:hypothetical protein